MPPSFVPYTRCPISYVLPLYRFLHASFYAHAHTRFFQSLTHRLPLSPTYHPPFPSLSLTCFLFLSRTFHSYCFLFPLCRNTLFSVPFTLPILSYILPSLHNLNICLSLLTERLHILSLIRPEFSPPCTP